ncbi:MAG: hypothetical protein LBQ81_03820 [Zoogloeaceae bacterium]|jgi:hypothetical protein|nr:hypothetical protein [Zoogloeaceae bacterium]
MTQSIQTVARILRMACITALFILPGFGSAAPDKAGKRDDVTVYRYVGKNHNTLGVALTLSDNGRFAVTFSIAMARSVIFLYGNWKKQGERLCLTPDPFDVQLHGRYNPEIPSGYIFLSWRPPVWKERTPVPRLALAWRAAKTAAAAPPPARFVAADWEAMLLPIQTQTLYAALLPTLPEDTPWPETWPETWPSLQSRRFQFKPEYNDYFLLEAGGLYDDKDEPVPSVGPDTAIQFAVALIQPMFTENAKLIEKFPSPAIGDEKWAEFLRTSPLLKPPYCGHLDPRQMEVDLSATSIQPEEREDYRQFARNASQRMLDIRMPPRPRQEDQEQDKSIAFTPVPGTNAGQISPRALSLWKCIRHAQPENDDEAVDMHAQWTAIWNACTPEPVTPRSEDR